MTDARTSADRTGADRRTALRVGAATVAATAAAVVASSSSASAAAGQAVIQGGNNVVGSATTFVTTSGTTPTLQVRNNGTGAAAFFFSQSGNGFGGGTGGANRFGLSSANTGAAGKGAALGASGGKNVGLIANTASADRYAVTATNLAAVDGDSGALLADGGLGAGVVAANSTEDVPALIVFGSTVSFGHTYLTNGAVALTDTGTAYVFGASSAERPAITFSGVVALTGGAATVALDPDVVAGADLDGASVVVTPRTASMPNLFASVSGTGAVTIGGGVGTGEVNYHVTLHQPVPVEAAQHTGSGAVLGRARAVADALGRD